MKQATRQKIYEKFSGLCAYSGKQLPNNWQVDHCVPISKQHLYPETNLNEFWNLLPVLPILNHYKRAKDLEQFRVYIRTLHKRLKRLPIKTNRLQTQKRAKYLLEVAEHFGVTRDKGWNGVFYFETINQN